MVKTFRVVGPFRSKGSAKAVAKIVRRDEPSKRVTVEKTYARGKPYAVFIYPKSVMKTIRRLRKRKRRRRRR